MNHGIVVTMPDTENQKASNSIPKCNATNNKLIAGHKSSNPTDSIDFNVCLHEPKIILDKNVVAQYFKIKKNTDNTTTSYCNATELEGGNQILVTPDKCVDRIRNKLSVKKVLPNRSMLVKEKEVVLEGPIFSQNNNFFHNINEFIAKQSTEIGYSSTQILDNDVYKVQSCNKSESENDENTMFIKGEPIEMECGDDILFANGNGYYNENTVDTKTEPVEMECGDDILYTNRTNYFDEDAVSTLAESVEMECGDDILYTNGAGYYNNSDENSAEENQDFNYSYEDAQTNIPNEEIKQKIEIKNSMSPIPDAFEEQEDSFNHEEGCDYKAFIKKELNSHTISQNANFVNETSFATCEKCDRTFENSSLLKEHQFESCGLKYFYTCQFCPSTSWYSSTLKKHIEKVHSRELDKENIDDIMEAIRRSKQLDNGQSDGLNFKKQVVPIQAPRKATKKSAKRRTQKKKKKIFINYNEVKRILNISCFECNKDPVYVRGRTNQYCSQCHNEYTFQCRKCSRFYFKYDLALLHAKEKCKKKISKRTLTSSSLLKKVQEQEKSRPNTLSNKPDALKYFTTFCAMCNESLKQNGCSTETVCSTCNKTSIQFQCEICKQLFGVRATAKRHSQTCHRQWQFHLVNSSLSTTALCDHTYYRKNISDPGFNEIVKQIKQPQFTELTLTHKPAKRVYTGKKSQSIQS